MAVGFFEYEGTELALVETLKAALSKGS